MADAKLSALPVGAPVGGLDLFYSDQGGVSVSQSGTALATFLSGGGTPSLPNNSVQYNNAGAFGGAANFTITAGNPDVSAAGAYFYDGSPILHGFSSGSGNIFVGDAGSNFPAAATLNTGIGSGNTLSAMTNGFFNVAVGYNALTADTSGFDNTAVGANAAAALTTEFGNTAIGASAGQGATGVASTIFMGLLAGSSATGGNDNIGIGSSALLHISAGSNNVAIGTSAMGTGVVTGSNNIAVGSTALQNLTSGANNSAQGAGSLNACTTGSNNCGIGSSSLSLLTIGNGNFGLGQSALAALIDGGNNVAIGALSLQSTQHDSRNVGIGDQTLAVLNGGGGDNVAIGHLAGGGVSTGTGNLIIGPNTGANTQVTTGSHNVMIGFNQDIPTATASDQLNISNYIYGTGMSGTANSISPGKIGLGIQAPAVELDVAGSVKTASTLVAGLPAPGNIGARRFVSDALGPAFGAPVVGLGGVPVPVYDDGTQWVVG